MATITSSGMTLNVNQLVSQLVAAERAPYDTRITRAEAKVTTEFTALAQLKGSMSSLESALNGLKTPTDFQLRKATLSSTDYFDATADNDAAPGNYQVEVRQLASSAQIGSAAIAGGATAVAGTGTLNIALGTTSFDVTLTSPANTLADLRDAINASPYNPGVSAALITDVTGTHLVLGSSLTGVANDLRVTATGGDADLARFVHDPPNGSAMTVLTEARDAIVFVSGYEIRDPDNTIEGAIEGVRLTLKQAETGAMTSMSIAVDNAGIREKAQKFVTAYNVVANQISKLRSYNPETRAAGPLLGDAMLRGLETQMRRILADPVSGLGDSAYNTLASLGITTNTDGTLALDATRFDAVIARDPGAAGRLFGSENGVAVRLGEFLDQKLAADAELAARDARISARRKEIDQQKQNLETRVAALQARYLKQFSALDAMLTQMQSTSSYLAQQLASIPTPGG